MASKISRARDLSLALACHFLPSEDFKSPSRLALSFNDKEGILVETLNKVGVPPKIEGITGEITTKSLISTYHAHVAKEPGCHIFYISLTAACCKVGQGLNTKIIMPALQALKIYQI